MQPAVDLAMVRERRKSGLGVAFADITRFIILWVFPVLKEGASSLSQIDEEGRGREKNPF